MKTKFSHLTLSLVIAGVLAVIALIAMVIAYFMYLNLLSRAKQMLA